MAMTHSPGDPCWIELFTPDVGAAREFYGELFGWTSHAGGEEYGGYVVFERDGEPIAGCMRNDGSAGPSMWSVYLASDDPAGAAVGVWQPLDHKGISARGDIGAPAWFETLSNDYDAAVQFYREVFGWDTHTMSDTEEFRYTTLGEGDEALAGIMDATSFLGDQPSRWQFYVEVVDTDASVQRATDVGGKVIESAETTPYGRLAVIADPAGIPFAIMGPDPTA
jgi:predicted enzyme related to lactoylglutathione lyase